MSLMNQKMSSAIRRPARSMADTLSMWSSSHTKSNQGLHGYTQGLATGLHPGWVFRQQGPGTGIGNCV